MKKSLVFFFFGCALMWQPYAESSSSFPCNNGIIVLGDTIRTVKRKCHVVDVKESNKSTTSWITVRGKFKEDAVVSIRRGRVVRIDR